MDFHREEIYQNLSISCLLFISVSTWNTSYMSDRKKNEGCKNIFEPERNLYHWGKCLTGLLTSGVHFRTLRHVVPAPPAYYGGYGFATTSRKVPKLPPVCAWLDSRSLCGHKIRTVSAREDLRKLLTFPTKTVTKNKNALGKNSTREHFIWCNGKYCR